MATVEEVMAYASQNERICPMPGVWQKIYEMLPEKKRVGAGWEPALPLILAAWYEASPDSKARRFQEHLEWAASHGALEHVHQFLCGLEEDEWFHSDHQ